MLISIPLMLAAMSALCPEGDYARVVHWQDWMHHPVYGDPSFDSFERLPGNPIHRGAPPFEWPVNGYLFEDPRSGDWFVYVGLYAKGYAMTEGRLMECLTYRSRDRGRSWERLGTPFSGEPFRFDQDTSSVGHAPDVSVLYADGRYHMIYDWASVDTRWESASNPTPPADNGVGYAWAERPEGPFIRTSPAVYRTGKSPLRLGKYRRGYAASLVKRDHDWMVLFMMDSGPHFGWGLFGTTAPRPEGPYSEPVPLRTVDGDYFHPPLMEFFPAFQHNEFVYAPSTSVALNRNFQAVFRARTEDAHRAEAWEMHQCGSVWHAEPVPNEHYGIWGQTFSGFVDKTSMFNVMFPSRDTQGMGTINLARRPWERPFRESGFVLSGHQGPSLALLKRAYSGFSLSAVLKCRGEVSLLWGYHAPLGPNRPAADATLHPLSLTRHHALTLSGHAWRVSRVGNDAPPETLGSGTVTGAIQEIALAVNSTGAGSLRINGEAAWEGKCEMLPGAVGLNVAPLGSVEVRRFSVSGVASPLTMSYLFGEAILGAASAGGDWRDVQQPEFRYRVGAVSLKPGARAKWNVEGNRFELWSPTGPAYGNATLTVDGVPGATLDLSGDTAAPSHAVWTSEPMPEGPHAIVLLAGQKPVPLDVLLVTTGAEPASRNSR